MQVFRLLLLRVRVVPLMCWTVCKLVPNSDEELDGDEEDTPRVLQLHQIEVTTEFHISREKLLLKKQDKNGFLDAELRIRFKGVLPCN